MICPNQSHPLWKKLVSKVGLDSAYAEYIKNNYDIPTEEYIDNLDINNYQESNIIFNNQYIFNNSGLGDDKKIQYYLKSVNILFSNKAKQIFNKGQKNNWSLDKILTELQIPKEQKKLILSFDKNNREDIVNELISNYSYRVEINTAKQQSGKYVMKYDEEGNPLDYDTEDLDTSKNTQHYSNLTVPGGTNYTENEIATPLITPSVKGHAQFSTNNGIGWFRSDELPFKTSLTGNNFGDWVEGKIEDKNANTKTRRILEVQSDLFQKGRTRETLVWNQKFANANISEKLLESYKDENKRKYLTTTEVNRVEEFLSGDKTIQSELDKTNKENQFLQLLNKDNNWVTFFVKSIIQDSAKKGYEKILFPSGNTASKVEGHSTLEEFKKQKENRINKLEKEKIDIENAIKEHDLVNIVDSGKSETYGIYTLDREIKVNYNIASTKLLVKYSRNNKEELKKIIDNSKKDFADALLYIDNEIAQLKQELERVETEGFGALKPIYNFYENTVTNILKKQGFNPVLITDEYDNTWNEVIIENKKYIVDLLPSSISEFKNENSLNEQINIVNSLVESIITEMNNSKVEGNKLGFNKAFNNVIDELKILSEDYKEDGLSTYSNRINNILSNLDETDKFVGYKYLVRQKFDNFKFIINEDEEVEEYQTSDNAYMSSNFEKDPEQNLNLRVKRFLAFIPVLNENEETVPNYIGLQTYYKFDDLYRSLLDQVSNKSPYDFEEIFKDLSLKNVMFKSFYNQYIELTDSEKNAVKSSLTKQSSDLYFVSYWPADNKGKISAEVIRSNRGTAKQELFEEWEQNFINLKDLKILNERLFDLNKSEGFEYYTINTKATKILNKNFKSLKDKYLIAKTSEDKFKILNSIGELFNFIGITISGNELKHIIDTGKFGDINLKRSESERLKADQLLSDLGYIFESLSKDFTENKTSDYDPNNIFQSGENGQLNRIKSLAQVSLIFNPNKKTGSFTNGEGNTVYPFVERHFLNSYFGEITKTNSDIVEMLNNDIFTKDSYWLRQLNDPKTRKEFLNNFTIGYFDAIKNRRKTERFGKTFENLSDKERILSRMNLFFNSGNKQAYYVYPTPSDKTTFPIIGGNKLNLVLDNNLKVSRNSEAYKELYNLALSELLRVNQTINYINNNQGDRLISGYHTNEKTGKRFFMFPFMNDVFSKYIDNENTISITEDSANMIQEGLDNFIVDLYEKQKNTLLKEGIITKDSNMFDKSYLSQLSNRTDINSLYLTEYAIYDYVINDAIAIGNIYQMFIGDPAMLAKDMGGKASNMSSKQIIDGTIVNVFKRIAKDIAPGREGVFNSYNYNSIFINEPKLTESEIVKLNSEYTNLDIADAQEWLTLKEYIDILFAYGQLDQNVYDTVNEKIKTKEDLTKEEIGQVLQPLKPVHTWRKNRGNEDNLLITYYIKTSAIPLIPQLVKGTSLENLYNIMEKNNVQHAVVKSGVKAGFSDAVTVFNSEGGVLTEKEIQDQIDINPFTIKNLDRRGFRIQQDVPYDEEKEEILLGTQLAKLIFSNLEPNWNFNGKSSSEIKSEFDSLIKEFINNKYDKFFKQMNIEEREGKFYITDLKEFKKSLEEQSKTKGFDPNDLFELNVIEENDIQKFEINPFFNTRYKEIESVFNALISNKIMKRKLPGKSFVQASSIGFESLQDQGIESIITEDQLTKEGIVYTKDWKGSLDYRIDDNGGVYAEILMPFNFIGNNGLLDVKQFVDKDGFIDTSKIDPELLEQVGYRIPTQGHMSMVKLKIVGFLPSTVGDLMVVPAAITKQMGSDFDVDKVYSHKFNYKYNYGKLKVSDDVETKIVKIFKTILESPYTAKLVTKTLSSDPLKDAVERVRKSKGITTESNLGLLDRIYNDEQVKVNRDGKVMIGISSLSSTHHALSQYANLYLSKKTKDNNSNPILFIDDKGVVYTDRADGNNVNNYNDYTDHPLEGAWRFDKIYGFDNTHILDTIAFIQTAATDNAKDPILGKGNINRNTANVALLIARAGFNEEWISNFTMQEVLVNMSNRLDSELDDITEMTYISNKKDKIVDDIKEKLIAEFKKLGGDIEALSNNHIFSLNELKSLNEQFSGEKDLTYYLRQYQILDQFLKYEKTALELSKIQNALNFETKGLGKDIYSLKLKIDQIKNSDLGKLEENITFKNTKNFLDNSYMGTLLEKGVLFANNLFNNEQMFPYDSEAFNNIYDVIKDESNKFDKDILDEKFAEEINIAVRSSIYTHAVNIFNDIKYQIPIKQVRENLLFGDNSLANKIAKLKQENNNNYFLNKLSVEIKNNNEPHKILYKSSYKVKSDEKLLNSIAWLELYNSEETKQVAIDLVKYSLITGNERTTNDIGRFIPYDLKKSLGLIDFLNRTNIDMVGTVLLRNFVFQFFQHNPQYTKQLIKDTYNINKTQTEITLKPENIDKYLSGDNLPSYLSLYVKGENRGKSKQILFVRVSDYTYQRVDTLGDNNTNEYDLMNTVGYSIINENKSPVKYEDKTVNTKDSLLLTQAAEDNGIYRENNTDITLKDYLQNIVSNSKEDSYVNLANYIIENNKEFLNNVDVSLDYIKGNARGATEYSTLVDNSNDYFVNITVDPNHIENKTDQGLKEVLMHETMHALTSLKIEYYFNNPEGNLLTDSEKLAIKSLIQVVKQIKVLVSKEELPKIIKSKFEYILSKDDKKAVKELIAYSFTDTDIKQWLNSKKSVNVNKSILDRIKDLIIKLLGLDINKDSLLYETAISIIDLIQDNESITNTNTGLNIPTDNIDMLQGNSLLNNVFKGKITSISDAAKKLKDNGLISYSNNNYYVNQTREVESFNKLVNINNEFKKLGLQPLFRILPAVRKQNTGTFTKNEWYRPIIFNKQLIDELNTNKQTVIDFLPSDGSEKFTKIVENLKSQIKLLEKRRVEDKSRYEELTQKIEKIEKRISDISKKQTNDEILKHSVEQINEFIRSIDRSDKLLTTDLSSGQILNIMSSLQEGFYTIEGWNSIDEFIDFESEDNVKWDIIQRNIIKVRKKYIKTLQKAFLKYNTDILQKKEGIDKMFSPQVDVSMLNKNFLDLSVSDSSLLRSVYEIIERASDSKTNELNITSKKINDLLDNLEKITGLKGIKAYDVLLQYDKNNKWTGSLVQKYKIDYYRTLSELKSKAKESGDWSVYYNYLNDNTLVMSLNDFTNKTNKNFTEEDYKEQQKLLDRFEKRKKYEEDTTEFLIELTLTDDNLTEEEKEQKVKKLKEELNIWIDINSPYNYWKNKNRNNKKADRYIFKKPTDKWIDPSYVKIKSNKELYNIYNELKDILKSNYLKLPNKPPYLNYIPDLYKTHAEKYLEQGLFDSSVSGLKDWGINLISEDLNNAVESEVRINGQTVKSIPIGSLQDKFLIEDKSKDLRKILVNHTETALHYEYMSEIEPLAFAAKQFIGDMIANKEVAGKKVKNFLGKEVEIKGGLINAKEQLEYYIDTKLYKNNKDQEFVGSKKKYTEEDLAKIKKLDEDFKNKKITEEVYNKRKENIGKFNTGSKTGDTLISLNYLQALALNPISAVVNGTFGIVTNMMHASGQVDYNNKDVLKALKIVMGGLSQKASLNSKETTEKLYAFATRLGLITDVTEGSIKKSVQDKVMFMQSKSEFIAQSQSMVAHLLHTDIWNKFDVVDGELKLKEGEQEIDMYKLKSKVQQINKYLHGNYKDPILIKKSIIGRALMLYRTWIPYTLTERFSKEYYDDALGRFKKGRYRTIKDIYKEYGLGKTLTKILSAQIKSKSAFENLKDVDVENLKKFTAEIRMTVLLLSVLLYLKSLIDDDEENAEVLRLVLNSTNRVYSDLTFFINPNSTNSILRNAVPATKTLADVVDIFTSIPSLLSGEDEYQRGPRKGRSKTLKEINDVIPITNQWDKITSAMNYIYSHKN